MALILFKIEISFQLNKSCLTTYQQYLLYFRNFFFSNHSSLILHFTRYSRNKNTYLCRKEMKLNSNSCKHKEENILMQCNEKKMKMKKKNINIKLCNKKTFFFRTECIKFLLLKILT